MSLAKEMIRSTSRYMMTLLNEEWKDIANSPSASREPVAAFIQKLIPYTSFGTQLLRDGLTELLIACLEPIPIRGVPQAYGRLVIFVARFLLTMPFSKISPLHIGELRMFYRNINLPLLPEGQDYVTRAKKKLSDYTNEKQHYYSDAEIMELYQITEPTHKRVYRQYIAEKKQKEIIFKAFVQRVRAAPGGRLPYGEQSGFARLLDRSESTVRGWKAKVLRNDKWRPWNTDRSRAHRLFSDEVEAAIAQHINDTFFEEDLLFTNDDFRQLVFELWCEDKDDWQKMDEFKCSAGFITDFKARNRISSRKLHYKRRPTVTAEQKTAWMDYVHSLLSTANADLIINMDETHWQTFPNGIMTWRRTGSDAVQVRMNGNEKQGLTVLASVTASGKKLPLLILAKGKTERCEQTQLPENIGRHFKFHSSSGWSTQEVMLKYLELLRAEFPGGQRLHLILDMYSSHRMDEVIAAAGRHNIEMHFIPAGLTDEFQPLDRRVFGCLKASGRAAFRRLYQKDPKQKFSTRSAVECLVKAWEHLSEDVIEEAWEIYVDE